MRTASWPLIFLLVGGLASSSLATSSPADEVTAHFQAGVEASRAGQFEKAIAEYTAVLKLEPELPEAHTNLGLAYHSLGLYRAAVSEFETALREKPDLPAANLFLGIDYLRLGSAAKAVAPLETVVRVQPSSREARRALVICYLDQDRYREAAEQLSAVSSLQTERSEALYALAHGYLDLASRLSDEMSVRYQATAWANRLAGDLLSESLRWSDAAIMYRQALKLDQQQVDVHESLGNAYQHLGDAAAAQQEFRAAFTDRDSTDPCISHEYGACARKLQSESQRGVSSNLKLGEALYELGQDSQAAEVFAGILQRQRQNVEARYWLVRTYKHLADESFEQLVEHFPDSWRTHQFRAESDQLRYAYDDAITEYVASVSLHSDDAELHQKLSQLYLEKKEFREAEKELTKAIELDPSGSRSLYLLGRCRLGEDEEQESIPLFERALQLDPSLLEAHAAIGQAYMRLKNPERARPELEKALAIDVHGDLHYLLFVAYRDLGKPDLAQRALAASQQLRKNAAARQQAKIAQTIGP